MFKTNQKLCEAINRTHFELIVFGFSRVDNTWNGTNITPAYSRLYYITAGNASILLKNKKKLSLIPGNWYLLPSGCSFDFCCEDSMEHIFFHLRLSSSDGLDMLQQCEQPITLEQHNFDFADCIGSLDKTDVLSSLYIRNLIENTVFQILEYNKITLEEKNISPCVSAAINYINNNLSLILSMNDILDHNFVSKSTLTNHFKKYLGLSVHEYIFGKIMYEAEQLIRQNIMSVREISEKYGFYDQFYFSRCFKKRYGMSPVEYRKNRMI